MPAIWFRNALVSHRRRSELSCLTLLPLQPNPRIADNGWMDGLLDGQTEDSRVDG